MQTVFDVKLAEKYHSMPQRIKAMTEGWVGKEIFCPACGCPVNHFENGRPVADFFCNNCREEYELKSKRDSMGKRILDGAYGTMIERLQSDNNPNFFFLNYIDCKVKNFLVVPKHFFTPEIIIKRKHGIPNRPKYIMCSIDLSPIPQSGKIFYIKNGKLETKKEILKNWQKTLFLRKEKKNRGWILDVINCVEKIGKKEFSLNEIYAFEDKLKIKYPHNNFIKDKLRQQLQVLRDRGYLEFVSPGRYKLAT